MNIIIFSQRLQECRKRKFSSQQAFADAYLAKYGMIRKGKKSLITTCSELSNLGNKENQPQMQKFSLISACFLIVMLIICLVESIKEPMTLQHPNTTPDFLQKHLNSYTNIVKYSPKNLIGKKL